MRWLAVLVTGGTVAGGGAALANPLAEASAKTTSHPTFVTASSHGQSGSLTGVDTGIQQLLTEANQLQGAITTARSELAHVSALRPTVVTAAPGSANAGEAQRLAAEQAALATEGQQLAAQSQQLTAEESALGPERQQLATEAQQITTEQAQLQQEAAAVAAGQTQTTTPPTHSTTGATTSKEGSND